MSSTRYDESTIQVLKGLEPVRQRPGMYTRTDHPLHIVQEVIDNAADEALGGHAKSIRVTQHVDGSVSVEDDGRGIPVGLHPEEGIPVAELVFTQLHAGGKFNKADGGAYAFSGGLHGVGVAVTNALSKRLVLQVWRDGQAHEMSFKGGAVVSPLAVTGTVGKRRSGTRVQVWPDARYFDAAQIPQADLLHALRSKAVLLPGLLVELIIEKTGVTHRWQFSDGLRGYLQQALGDTEPLTPVFEAEQYAAPDDEQYAAGEGAHWAVVWTADGAVVRESYVNLIATPAGGTHEAGLRDGLFQSVRAFAELHGLVPKGVRLMPDDVFARASFILSARLLDPQFQGQIKEKLNSRDAVRLVGTYVKNALDLWLSEHVDAARRLADAVIRQAQARLRSAQKVEKRKSSGVAVLPGKLTDCESTDLTRNELFLVEGDSAGGSAKMGRDKTFQAVLPLRGKVLNTWEVDRDRLFANNEVHDMAVAIGVDPHGPDQDADLSGLRYGRICVLADADVDGSHIQVLLLTLFFRHFPRLIEAGHIYVARPPLFRVDVPAAGKRPARKLYCLDAIEMDGLLERLRREGVREGSWSVNRFKGLGEMSAEQLWETTLNPDTRRLLRVDYGVLDRAGTLRMFDMLMGRGEAGQRRTWLEEKGNMAELDI